MEELDTSSKRFVPFNTYGRHALWGACSSSCPVSRARMIHLDPDDFQTFLQPAEMNPTSEKDEALARGLKSRQITSKCGGSDVREGSKVSSSS